jgi:hypothetical protein
MKSCNGLRTEKPNDSVHMAFTGVKMKNIYIDRTNSEKFAGLVKINSRFLMKKFPDLRSEFLQGVLSLLSFFIGWAKETADGL